MRLVDGLFWHGRLRLRGARRRLRTYGLAGSRAFHFMAGPWAAWRRTSGTIWADCPYLFGRRLRAYGFAGSRALHSMAGPWAAWRRTSGTIWADCPYLFGGGFARTVSRVQGRFISWRALGPPGGGQVGQSGPIVPTFSGGGFARTVSRVQGRFISWRALGPPGGGQVGQSGPIVPTFWGQVGQSGTIVPTFLAAQPQPSATP
jgi:hypothetical protein